MNQQKEISLLRKQNKIMKEALKFYANKGNYGHDGEPFIRRLKPYNELDLGSVAREALERLQEENLKS